MIQQSRQRCPYSAWHRSSSSSKALQSSRSTAPPPTQHTPLPLASPPPPLPATRSAGLQLHGRDNSLLIVLPIVGNQSKSLQSPSCLRLGCASSLILTTLLLQVGQERWPFSHPIRQSMCP